MEFWYKFVDSSAEQGSNRCGFAVAVSLKKLEELTDKEWQIIQERVSEIKIDKENSADLEITQHPDIPGAFYSINSGIGRYGLDYHKEPMSVFLSLEKEDVAFYATHNCINSQIKHALERAFLTWARMIDAKRG